MEVHLISDGRTPDMRGVPRRGVFLARLTRTVYCATGCCTNTVWKPPTSAYSPLKLMRTSFKREWGERKKPRASTSSMGTTLPIVRGVGADGPRVGFESLPICFIRAQQNSDHGYLLSSVVDGKEQPI